MSIKELLEEVENKKKGWHHAPPIGLAMLPYYGCDEYMLWLKRTVKYLTKHFRDDNDAKRFIELANEHPRSCYNDEMNEMITCLKMLEDEPVEEMSIINNNELFSEEILGNAKLYYKKLLKEINDCYKYGIYDACFILIRKLINTLLVEIIDNNGNVEEVYENNSMKDLRTIISIFLNKRYWRYDKRTDETLAKIRDYGNGAAHNFYFSAKKSDIDREYDNYRFLIEELCINTIKRN